jgi:hypothetical protein
VTDSPPSPTELPTGLTVLPMGWRVASTRVIGTPPSPSGLAMALAVLSTRLAPSTRAMGFPMSWFSL